MASKKRNYTFTLSDEVADALEEQSRAMRMSKSGYIEYLVTRQEKEANPQNTKTTEKKSDPQPEPQPKLEDKPRQPKRTESKEANEPAFSKDDVDFM